MTGRALWIALAAQAAGAIARGEPAPPSPPAATAPAAPGGTAEQRALDHLDRGVAAYRAHEFTLAHAELVEANRLAPDRPNPYRWLAIVEAELGDCASARAHVEGFLSRVAVGDPRVAEMTALRASCRSTAPTAAAAPGEAMPSLTVQAPVSPAPPTPLVRRWWFWAAIGAVAVTAAGITYGATRGSDPRLPPVTCDPAGCRP